MMGDPRIKPKAGFILLRAEWFDSVVALPELAGEVASDARILAEQAKKYLDVAGPWVVNSPQALAEAEKAVSQADLDLVVLVFQVWAEDFYLIPLLKATGSRPLAVWCYQPWQQPPRPASFIQVLRGSGPVGTLEGLGTLRNLGRDFFFTLGSPLAERPLEELACFARAAQAARGLRSARFGILPYRNDQMQSTFVDEFRLLADLGPTVQYLSVGELVNTIQGIPEAEADEFVKTLRREYPIRGVSDPTLKAAALASLGLAQLAASRQLDYLSLNDIAPELHEALGLRPCLYPPVYDEAGLLAGLEGDLGAGVAMWVLNRLSDSPVFFGETWFWDENENLIVMGHAGLQNPAIASPGKAWISHDFEFAQSDRTEGAHYQFIARPGRVTLFQVRGTPQGWQAIAASGEAIETDSWVEGYPHAAIRLDESVADFICRAAQVGSTQHWAMAYGDCNSEIREFCKLVKIPLSYPT